MKYIYYVVILAWACVAHAGRNTNAIHSVQTEWVRVITNQVETAERPYLSDFNTPHPDLSGRAVQKLHLERPSAIGRYKFRVKLSLDPNRQNPDWDGERVIPMVSLQVYANDGPKYRNTVEITPGGGMWRLVAGGEAWSEEIALQVGESEAKVVAEGYFRRDQYLDTGDYLIVVTPWARHNEPFGFAESKDYRCELEGTKTGTEFVPGMDLSILEMYLTERRPTFSLNGVNEDYGWFYYSVLRVKWGREFPGWLVEVNNMESPGWYMTGYSYYPDSEGYDQARPWAERPRVAILSKASLPQNVMFRLRFNRIELMN